jgi:undecaprenyl-diphosphatase
MNIFDSSIINFLNGFFARSKIFDSAINIIADNDLVKGGAVVSILWYFWFQNNKKISFISGRIIGGLISSIVSVIVARLLALSLPYRVRPYLNPDMKFFHPFEKSVKPLESWSSFPSDHAAMFFALATCIFLISRKVGILTYLYVIFLVCFPRVYLGYHYPTDLLVGGLIGVVVTLIFSNQRFIKSTDIKAEQFRSKYPGLFYALLFLLTFQVANLFFESREILGYLLSLIHSS